MEDTVADMKEAVVTVMDTVEGVVEMVMDTVEVAVEMVKGRDRLEVVVKARAKVGVGRVAAEMAAAEELLAAAVVSTKVLEVVVVVSIEVLEVVEVRFLECKKGLLVVN